MRFVLLILSAAIIALIALLVQTRYFSSTACHEGDVTPVFSPYNSEEIFELIKNAKHEIKVEVYEFSYRDLADALVKERENGISVKVIFEPSVYNNKDIFNYLLNSGIDVSWASKKFHNTHSKFMIIDDSIVFVGSLNWSENAIKYNREASVIIYSKEIAGSFEKIFDMDFGD